MDSRKTLSLASLWILALGLSLEPQAQAPVPAQNTESIYTLKVYHDLVLVDVAVTDRKGKPIRNLHKEDFTVFEDSAPQKISTFDFEDLSTTLVEASPSAPAGSSSVIDLGKTPLSEVPITTLQDRRLMILFVDQSSMPVEDLIQAQKTVKNFVEKQLTPADLVSVVSNTSTLKVLQDFTNDREALEMAVSRLHLGESAGLADLGTTDPDTSGDSSEDTSDAFTADETQYNIFNTDRKLSAIESVGRMFGTFPGKKFLVHFSSGISTTGVENQSQLRSTINTLNQNNTSLYSVDVRGLVAVVPGGDASKGSATGTANYSGKAFRDQSASLANSQETLVALAHDTGGKALLDNNNLGRVFDLVKEDSDSYYILGYSSNNTRRDGKYRQIKVQVGIPGARLKYRQGYFAPKAFGQFTQADKERQLEEAASTERPFNDIPFLVSANYVMADAQRVFVPVSLKFSASAIPFQQKGKKSQAEFDFIGQVRDSKDKPVTSVRDTIRVNLDPTSYRKVASGDIQYNTGFYLPAGKYDLKFLLRENQGGKMSSFEQPLVVPDYSQPGPLLSSIILSNRLEPVGSNDSHVKNLSRSGGSQGRDSLDPLVIDQLRIVPNVARVFTPSNTLYIFFQTYLHLPKGAQPSLGLSISFLKDGALFREAGKTELTRYDDRSSGTITSHFQVPLSEFPKGDYQLQVRLTDPVSQKSLVQEEKFVIR
jgi:VWFA-related protein